VSEPRRARDGEKEIELMSQYRNASRRRMVAGCTALLAAGLLASGLSVLPLQGQSTPPAATPAPAVTPAPASAPAAHEPSHFPKREQSYYQLFFGVDSIAAKAVESGELIKFSYRVLDAEKARPLNDKTNEPVMFDPVIKAKLVIPSLEKVGQLRQSSTPEAGKSYWMAFSNPGRVVKRGDRVSVTIGQFHIEGLVVE
jgi:hypothetical protein